MALRQCTTRLPPFPTWLQVSIPDVQAEALMCGRRRRIFMGTDQGIQEVALEAERVRRDCEVKTRSITEQP